MIWNHLAELISLVVGGGLGALILQIYTAKANKRKIEVEVQNALLETKQKEQAIQKDAFNSMYQELNTCIKDYSAIAEEYREYREGARKREADFQARIQTKCEELARIKARMNYLEGLKCYDTTCPKRIKISPNDKRDANIDMQKEKSCT